MDTTGQRMEGGRAATDPDAPEWQRRGNRAGLREAACGAPRAPDNQRIRELLGWGLIPANDGWRQHRQ